MIELLSDKIIIWFLGWLISWADIAQGIIGVLTLGLYHPALALEVAKIYSRKKYRWDKVDHGC